MLVVKLSIQPVDQGWAVRIGPDVLVRFPTKEQAILNADRRAEAIRGQGGHAVVMEEPPGAMETGAPGAPLETAEMTRFAARARLDAREPWPSGHVLNNAGRSRPASKGNG
jgi:hypothetical protein